jgi:inorganic pyrophosphatase
VRVFIENEAGSTVKHLHNEKTLELKGTMQVSRPYPFPYGFVLNTTAHDSDNADCFILTNTRLSTGEIVECDPLALMEQIEDGEIDHKILALLKDDQEPLREIPAKKLREFVRHVFDHLPDKVITVGEFRDRETALSYLHDCQDVPTDNVS